MSIKDMWTANATVLVILIVLNMTLTFISEALWIAIGVLALLAAMFLSFRQGMRLGHGACGVSSTIEDVRKAGDAVYAQLDAGYLRQGWSRANGVRGMLASALLPYALGAAYIALALLKGAGLPLEIPVVVARVAAWIVSLPFWPIITHWHADFVTLTPDIAAMLLVTPFVLPVCTLAGYMQGPRLWAQTETAMKEGRRRAKAKARVGKKMVPKQRKPEI